MIVKRLGKYGEIYMNLSSVTLEEKFLEKKDYDGTSCFLIKDILLHFNIKYVTNIV